MNSQQEKPTFLQLELGYNSLLLKQISIEPDSLLQAPQILLNKIDQQTGRISFAISFIGDNFSSGSAIARVNFVAQPAPFGQTTPISFLPKTTIRTTSTTNPLIQTSGTKLIFSSQSAEKRF